MRLIPRRKRTWLLTLLAAIMIGATALWLAASAKSDFEKRYDQIRVGSTVSEVSALIEQDPHPVFQVYGSDLSVMTRYGWDNGGEEVVVYFEDDRVVEKNFTPLDMRGRLRRQWVHTFKSAPPF